MSDPRIAPADFDDPAFGVLVDLHLSAMRDHSPADSVHALGLEALKAPDVSVLVLSQEGRAASMGAIRPTGEGVFEIKSMRTHPADLGRGCGRAMLEHLIAQARASGGRRVSLETGSGPPFEPALALYRSRGFQPGSAFGNCEATAFNQFLHLDLGVEPEPIP